MKHLLPVEPRFDAVLEGWLAVYRLADGRREPSATLWPTRERAFEDAEFLSSITMGVEIEVCRVVIPPGELLSPHPSTEPVDHEYAAQYDGKTLTLEESGRLESEDA
ncbi:MAG: hypothetical protein M5U26_19610 [Planctomycetota bacterium]|nr:hypothetical protein [Planctomycetota bacterium]